MMLVTPSSSDLTDYIEATLRVPMVLTPWAGSASLPAFLTDTYTFLEGTLLNQPLLFACTDRAGLDPSAVVKQMVRIGTVAERPTVLATASLSAADRRKFIELSIPFVIPGNQLFLPDLGIELREHFKVLRERNAESFSPSTQVVLFDFLLNGDRHGSTPGRIAKRLDYSAMTVGRAVDELEGFGLARIKKLGREKRILFVQSGRALFEAALPYARNPVKDRHYVQGEPDRSYLTVSGDTALSRYTDISPTRLPVFAVAPAGRGYPKRPMTETDAPFDADFALETWRYDPSVLAQDGIADRLSLYVQYKDDPDPRIAAAASNLLEGMQWRS